MTRDVRYRIDVLRGGAKYAELQWDDSTPPQISAAKDATIHTSLRATVLPDASVDLLADELQPVVVIDGKESPLGIFRATTVRRQGSAGKLRVTMEAYDRGWRASAAKTERIRHFAAGERYMTTVRQLLTECGITLVVADESNDCLKTDREDWQTGTSLLQIANELLREINFESLWFDASGAAHLQRYRAPSVERVKWRYGASALYAPEAHRTDDYTEEEDVFDAPNVFVCVCANPDMEAMTATAVNEDPSSRKSVFRRGMRIVTVERVDNAASQAALQEMANRLCSESKLSTKTLTFRTLAEPGHGIGDVIAISDDEIGGIYLETGWKLTMAAGKLMEHTAKRTVIA